MSPVAEIRFLTVDGRRLAYEVAGEGPLLVCPAWWVSHLELDRSNETFARFWAATGDGYSVGALLDELGVERLSLLGGSSGGCAAIAFAARFPERVERLVLYGSYGCPPS